MAKRSTVTVGTREVETGEMWQVAGLDVGDKECHLCVLDGASGAVVEEGRLKPSRASLQRRFEGVASMRIGLEAGVHSPWIGRLLVELGHEVIVANARKLRLIYRNRKKNDKVDAEYLARLARVDPALLHPLEHRGEQAQADLAVVRSRDLLVKSRTQLINHVRGVVKGFGERLPGCSSRAFAGRVGEVLPEPLRAALLPVVEMIGKLSEQIGAYEKQLKQMAAKRYPETQLLLAVDGVGAITALTFLLVLEDAERFRKSRSVGAYLGLVPGQDKSGEQNPELRITKEGDELLRRLLVQCGHYILGPFGKECDLKRHGERIAQRGGKRAKKRAVVAVARKLAVLLHCLWRNGEVYDPDYSLGRQAARRNNRGLPAA